MAEFFRLYVSDWWSTTDDLSLEHEAAFGRVVQAIRLHDQPIRDNMFVLCGLWRCNDRKAKRLRQDLIDLGLIWSEGGMIHNRRAVDDASVYRRLRAGRASAGHRGGIESGKARSKSLESNDTGQASASTLKKRKEMVQVVVVDDPDLDPDLFSKIIELVELDIDRLPPYWRPPASIAHMARWSQNMGLEISEIFAVISDELKRFSDPPDGPKAFDKAMERMAMVKHTDAPSAVTDRSAEGISNEAGSHISPTRRARTRTGGNSGIEETVGGFARAADRRRGAGGSDIE